MKKKPVFTLAGMFLAGVAVCGCQSSSPRPQFAQQTMPSSSAGVRTTTPSTMMPGNGGAPVYGATGPSTGFPISNGSGGGLSPAGGVNGQGNTTMPGTTTSGSNFQSTIPNSYGTGSNNFGSTSGVNSGMGMQQGSSTTPGGMPAMSGAGVSEMGGLSQTRTQYLSGSELGTISPPPMTPTLPQSSMPGR